MEYKIWMASSWKNNVSGTSLCSYRHQPQTTHLLPCLFFKDLSAFSKINGVTVVLLKTNCIQSVVRTLDNPCFTSRKDRYVSF